MTRIRYSALVIAALVVLIYLLELVFPGMVDVFAFNSAELSFRPWSIVTAMFLHNPTDYMHLVNNLFFLAVFGFILEQLIGTKRFLVLFVTGGVFANLSAFTFYPGSDVLGASGAVSVIVASLAVLRPHTVGLLWGVPAPMWAVLLGWIGLNAAGTAAVGGNIAFAAHLYGLGFGTAAGAFLRRRFPSEDEEDVEDVAFDVEAWEREHMPPSSG